MIPGNQASGGKFIDPPDSITVVPFSDGNGSDVNVIHTGYKGKSGLVKFRATSNTGETGTTTASSLSARTALVFGLTNGTSYTFSVVAIESESSVESISSPVSALTLVAGRPDAPTQPTTEITSAEFKIRLNWVAPADNGSPITGYKIYRRTSPANGWGEPSVTLNTPLLTYVFTESAGSFYYRVSAVNAMGNSAPSSSTDVATIAAPPPPPPTPPPPPPCNCDGVARRQYGQYSHLDAAGFGWTCDGTMSYEYYIYGTCGGGACPGEGGYNGAYRNGVCGYVTPPTPTPTPTPGPTPTPTPGPTPTPTPTPTPCVELCIKGSCICL